MNPGSYDTAPPSIAGTPSESPRYDLDIVQDCSDLRGKFPSNVELKFVYWRHENSDDTEDFVGQSSRLAPHCLQADVIAQEVASTAHATPQDAQREFQIINDIVSGRVRHNTIGEYYGNLASTSLLASCVELTIAMKGLARTKPPKFIVVDVLDNIDADTFNIDAASEAGLLEWAVALAAIMRRREAVTIRQLYQESCSLALDNDQRQIAVIYGTSHTFLSVATRALGAKTSRVFVNKPTLPVVTQLTRSLRYRQPADIQPEIELAEAADKKGFLIQSLAERVGLELAELGLDSKRNLELDSMLGLLSLQATKGLLRKTDNEAFNSDLHLLAPFLPFDKKVPLLKRQAVKKAAKRIIKLADKLVKVDKPV